MIIRTVLRISAFALPMIGIGMMIKLAKNDSQIGALDQALIGFGGLFMGIYVLKDTFSVLGDQVSLTSTGAIGINDILIYTGLGFLITLINAIIKCCHYINSVIRRHNDLVTCCRHCYR
jgi:phosphate:Na+ symporter